MWIKHSYQSKMEEKLLPISLAGRKEINLKFWKLDFLNWILESYLGNWTHSLQFSLLRDNSKFQFQLTILTSKLREKGIFRKLFYFNYAIGVCCLTVFTLEVQVSTWASEFVMTYLEIWLFFFNWVLTKNFFCFLESITLSKKMELCSASPGEKQNNRLFVFQISLYFQ